ETGSADRCNLLREEIRDGNEEESERRGEQTDWHFPAGDGDVQRRLVFLVVPAETQHENAESLHEEAPHHAERVRLAEQFHIAATAKDGGRLQDDNRIDEARRRAKPPVRPAEPGREHSIFGKTIQNAIRSND